MPIGPYGLGAIGALLVLIAGVLYRHRLARYTASGDDELDDDAIRRIESGGAFEIDDPTDPGEVAAEEERFWSESWDQPEEFGR